MDANVVSMNGAANKLGIPEDVLASVAGGLRGEPLRLNSTLLSEIANLPMTNDVASYRSRAAGLSDWKSALSRGVLPDLDHCDFPSEPFKSTFADTLVKLEMPRFTRRYPQLVDPLLRNMLDLVGEFELSLEEEMKQFEPPDQDGEEQQEPQQGQVGRADASAQQGEGGDSEPTEGEAGGDASEGQTSGQAGKAQGQGDPMEGVEMELELAEGTDKREDGGGQQSEGQGADDDGAAREREARLAERAAELAEEIVQRFEDEMAPVMDNVASAAQHFGDLADSMLSSGLDRSSGTWKHTGWAEFKDLQRKLSRLKELRDLVRSLGRSSGKGPKRRAPEYVYATGAPPGVIRSTLVPEETQGLYRSDSLTQMLPSETALLALGWPRSAADEASASTADGEDGGERGSHPARLLFMSRRAERGLMSYQRAGWLDGEPARVTSRHVVRPASEQGPILLCLDTSGSMSGDPETVAKALVLECARSAHRQGRACLVYAFSGPKDVKSIELDLSPTGLATLLRFLANSFGGGTDLEQPLRLCLNRLQEAQWAAADMLLVTDGEVARPSDTLLKQLRTAEAELDLKLHGLLVSRHSRDVPGRTAQDEVMHEVCTHVHSFKSWSSLRARA